MNIQITCPCCSNILIYHLDNHREYWFCRHCWTEMPNLETAQELKHQQSPKPVDLSTKFAKFNKLVLVG